MLAGNSLISRVLISPRTNFWKFEARGRLCVTQGEFDSVCVRARVCAHIHGYSVFADLLLVSEELTVVL